MMARIPTGHLWHWTVALTRRDSIRRAEQKTHASPVAWAALRRKHGARCLPITIRPEESE